MKYGFDSPEAEQFPPTITIDITNRCNLRCLHCPQDQLAKSERYIPIDIPLPYIRKIADELKNHENITVRISGDGEPLLHPHIADISTMLKRIGKVKTLTLFTNGLHINRFFTHRSLSGLYNWDIIDISIDAYTKETYFKIHGEDRLIQLEKDIIELIECREFDKPKIMVSFVQQPLNNMEVDDFRELWEPLVDKVIIRPFVDCKGLITDIPMNLPEMERYPCRQLWNRMNLNCFGEYRWCIEDMYNKTSFSNLWTESIESAWKHPMLERMRELHLDGMYNEICNSCDNWKMSTWDYNYETAIRDVLK